MGWVRDREALVKKLKDEGYIKSMVVERAMLNVKRHEFIPEWQKVQAYRDIPLFIGYGQTISAPHMVALMTEKLDLKDDNKVLEIGSGSGYQAAIIAEILTKGRLYSIERIPELVDLAQWNLGRAGYNNVHVICGEGTRGYKEESPYDRIIVTAGAPRIPETLFEQLKEGGKMLIPVGGRTYQELKLVKKMGRKRIIENLGGCMFVPLVGEDGW